MLLLGILKISHSIFTCSNIMEELQAIHTVSWQQYTVNSDLLDVLHILPLLHSVVDALGLGELRFPPTLPDHIEVLSRAENLLCHLLQEARDVLLGERGGGGGGRGEGRGRKEGRGEGRRRKGVEVSEPSGMI